MPPRWAELPEGYVDDDRQRHHRVHRALDRAVVFTTIWEAVLLVAAVCLFFLRNWRAMLVPLVTIPVSLVGGVHADAGSSASINTLTLLAAGAGDRPGVNDAIVVLENIYRHIEVGMEPLAAAFKGAGDRFRGGGDDDHAGRGVCRRWPS